MKEIKIVEENDKLSLSTTGFTEVEIIGILEFYKAHFLNKKVKSTEKINADEKH